MQTTQRHLTERSDRRMPSKTSLPAQRSQVVPDAEHRTRQGRAKSGDDFHTPRLTADDIRGIHNRIHEAFEREPDDAGILQGVRSFRKGRPHVRVVMVPSPKNDGYYIACEGRLEAAMAQCLEIDPEVVKYRGQPFKLPSPTGGSPFYPDFVAKHPDGTVTVIDVKPADKLLDPKVTDRMRQVRAVLREAEIHHCLVTEVELEREPLRQIRNSLRKAAHLTSDPYVRLRLLEFIGGRTLSVGALRSEAQQLGADRLAVERLALQGDLSFSLSTFWNDTTLIGARHATNPIPAHSWGTIQSVRIPLRGRVGPQG